MPKRYLYVELFNGIIQDITEYISFEEAITRALNTVADLDAVSVGGDKRYEFTTPVMVERGVTPGTWSVFKNGAGSTFRVTVIDRDAP